MATTKTLPLKVDAVLVELLNQFKESPGILPWKKLNSYLLESESYQKDMKEFLANKIKEAPNAI